MSKFAIRRVVLLIAASIGILIGLSIVLDPVGFHAKGGIAVPFDAALLNELRAAGGAILGVGLLALAGAFFFRLQTIALCASATAYTGYGLARLFGFVVDGVPGSALVWIAALELIVGILCLGTAAMGVVRVPAVSSPRQTD